MNSPYDTEEQAQFRFEEVKKKYADMLGEPTNDLVATINFPEISATVTLHAMGEYEDSWLELTFWPTKRAITSHKTVWEMENLWKDI